MTAFTVEETVTEFNRQGIPIDSVVRAAQYVNGLHWSTSQAQLEIGKLTGIKVEGEHVMRVPLVYGYLVQNVIKAHLADEVADIIQLLTTSQTQADTLLERQAWAFIADEEARADIENADPAVVIAGKAKKGARKVLGLKVFNDEIKGKDFTRKEAIAILIEKVGLTSSGASTYYHNFNSGKWT